MKVFISWSGERSQRLADAFRHWLPNALQFTRPYFTPSDIDKGTLWLTSVAGELKASAVSLIMVTPENRLSPWILFEAGAISMRIDPTRVCPIVFDMAPTDLEGPLAQFQATRFSRDDIFNLFKTINATGSEHSLSEIALKETFDVWWPRLEEKVEIILKKERNQVAAKPVRSDREMLEEVLELVRRLEARDESTSFAPGFEVLSNYLAKRQSFSETAGLKLTVRFRKHGDVYPHIIEHDIDTRLKKIDAIGTLVAERDDIYNYVVLMKSGQNFSKVAELFRTLPYASDIEIIPDFGFDIPPRR